MTNAQELLPSLILAVIVAAFIALAVWASTRDPDVAATAGLIALADIAAYIGLCELWVAAGRARGAPPA